MGFLKRTFGFATPARQQTTLQPVPAQQSSEQNKSLHQRLVPLEEKVTSLARLEYFEGRLREFIDDFMTLVEAPSHDRDAICKYIRTKYTKERFTFNIEQIQHSLEQSGYPNVDSLEYRVAITKTIQDNINLLERVIGSDSESENETE